jgi:hypothetical protein
MFLGPPAPVDVGPSDPPQKKKVNNGDEEEDADDDEEFVEKFVVEGFEECPDDGGKDMVEVDKSKVEAFRKGFVGELEALVMACQRAYASLLERLDLYSDLSPSDKTAVGSLLSLHLLMTHYFPTLADQWDTHKPPPRCGMNFIIFTRYYVPTVRDTFRNGVPRAARFSGVVYKKTFKWWMRLVDFLFWLVAALPCLMAVNHQSKCKKIWADDTKQKTQE